MSLVLGGGVCATAHWHVLLGNPFPFLLLKLSHRLHLGQTVGFAWPFFFVSTQEFEISGGFLPQSKWCQLKGLWMFASWGMVASLWSPGHRVNLTTEMILCRQLCLNWHFSLLDEPCGEETISLSPGYITSCPSATTELNIVHTVHKKQLFILIKVTVIYLWLSYKFINESVHKHS